MKLHIDNPTLAAQPGAAIAIRIYQSTTSRSGFDDVIANGDLGDTLYVPNRSASRRSQPDANGNVTITFGLSGSDVRRGSGSATRACTRSRCNS